MNAPVQAHKIGAGGTIEEFLEICDQQAWFYHEGWISLHTAVDNLQSLAERWGLVEECGQDAVQQWIAYEHVPTPADDSELAELDRLETARRIANWEELDRSLPDPPAPTKPHYRVPSSVIDAFWYVVGLKDSKRLAAWLRDHSQDAPTLLKLLERK